MIKRVNDDIVQPVTRRQSSFVSDGPGVEFLDHFKLGDFMVLVRILLESKNMHIMSIGE